MYVHCLRKQHLSQIHIKISVKKQLFLENLLRLVITKTCFICYFESIEVFHI